MKGLVSKMATKNNTIAKRIGDSLKEFADALKKNEKISEKFTCRRVVLDLQPMPYNPKAVKNTRNLLNASQAIFAQFLGVDLSTIQAWEQGRLEPSKLACRLMDDIQRNTKHWQKKLKEAIRVKESC
jgi:DNA-binding transcriptional regulator YiaG